MPLAENPTIDLHRGSQMWFRDVCKAQVSISPPKGHAYGRLDFGLVGQGFIFYLIGGGLESLR